MEGQFPLLRALSLWSRQSNSAFNLPNAYITLFLISSAFIILSLVVVLPLATSVGATLAVGAAMGVAAVLGPRYGFNGGSVGDGDGDVGRELVFFVFLYNFGAILLFL